MASACEDWEIHDGLSDAAATVAAELVSNAVDHAGTPCVLHLALDHRRLQVAVRDSRPVRERRPQITVAGERGFGLLIVQPAFRG
jgi:anti-sigma regulatory factor (Ser/Thr protein kinase)